MKPPEDRRARPAPTSPKGTPGAPTRTVAVKVSRVRFARVAVPGRSCIMNAYMDTRQLAAFCAVVERKSFSQAAERLGVTQPAVSLQIRSLEKRLGQQLLDRSGRRVEPTEAGLRVYRGAQRMLALEEQLVEEVAGTRDGEVRGSLAIGASTGPGGNVVPVLLCEFQRRHPAVSVELSI